MNDPAESGPEEGAPGRLGSNPAFEVLACAAVDSTNDEARRRAGAGAADRTVIWAERQSAGRGRRGRRWESPAGNLYCSVILRPDCPPAACAQLSLVTAVALGEALEACLPERARPQLKWPNDVLIDGRKVAGILLESEPGGTGGLAWVVVGLGVNVATFPDGTEYPATALACETAAPPGVREVLDLFLARFQPWYGRWRQEGLAPVRAAWLDRACGLDRPLTIRLQCETFTGRFAGLDGDGALLLYPAGSADLRRVTAGDVFFPWLSGRRGPADPDSLAASSS